MVRIAKAKVAGSNPVFRSKEMGPGVADLASAPGPAILAPRTTETADALLLSPSTRKTKVVALHSRTARWQDARPTRNQ